MQRSQAIKFQSRRNATDCHIDVGSNYRRVYWSAFICSYTSKKPPCVKLHIPLIIPRCFCRPALLKAKASKACGRAWAAKEQDRRCHPLQL